MRSGWRRGEAERCAWAPAALHRRCRHRSAPSGRASADPRRSCALRAPAPLFAVIFASRLRKKRYELRMFSVSLFGAVRTRRPSAGLRAIGATRGARRAGWGVAGAKTAATATAKHLCDAATSRRVVAHMRRTACGAGAGNARAQRTSMVVGTCGVPALRLTRMALSGGDVEATCDLEFRASTAFYPS